MQPRHPFAFTSSAALVAALLGASSAAHAEPDAAAPAPRLPLAEARRPITSPALVFNPRLEFDVRHQPAQGTYVDLGVSATFGITDDFTVRALVLPLQLSAPTGRRFQYGQVESNHGPSIGATYRFVRGAVELGAGLDLRVFTIEGLSGGAIIPSVHMRFHASDVAAIDFDPSVNITRATSTQNATVTFADATGGQTAFVSTTSGVPANAVRVDVPIRALYNVSEPVHIGANSGLTIYDVSHTKDTAGIPVGVFAGYAVAGSSGPILDIDPFFEFPYLLFPAREKVTNAAQYIVGLNVIGHLYW